MDEKYLRPTPTIDSDNRAIGAKVRELAAGKSNQAEISSILFYFVRDAISYNLYVNKHMPEHFRASSTLERGQGYCVQKAVLLAAMARAAGIPARLGFAKIRNNLVPQKVLSLLGTDIFPWHGYTDLYLSGKWVKATPAFDVRMCRENRFIPVEFDGRADARFPQYDLDGRPHIEYLLDRGPRDEVPLNDIRSALIERNMLDPAELVGTDFDMDQADTRE
ncbi:MAG: transglutaminase domain-containing protein [Dehalococcoidia bacterium]|nr:transglutaminase domain-containing protein [Dehalococcoidia bacterium]